MKNLSAREIQRRRIYEDVVDFLLEDMRNGVYKIGEELPSERTLMDEFQVGRPAIREALFTLSRMGVIEIRVGTKAKVCKPNVIPLLEDMGGVVLLMLQTEEGEKYFQEARRFFECAVARRAAANISNGQVRELSDILAHKSRTLGDVKSFATLDLKFHRFIVNISQNPLLTAIHDNLGKWLLDQRLKTLAIPGQPETAYKAHVKIYEALKRKDIDAAETAMEEHLIQIQSILEL